MSDSPAFDSVRPRGYLVEFGSGGEAAAQERHAVHPNTALLHYEPDDAVWTHAKGPGLQVWCSGEILSYRGNGDTAACLQEVVADWQAGTLAYERLNGRFVLIIWDEAAASWEIVTDRMGAMHAYAVWRSDRLLTIGSDLGTVARKASERNLNWEGLASFFAMGFYVDDQTLYADTHVLKPASVYRISAQGELVEHRRYFTWHHTVDEQRNFDETVEAYDTLFRQAMARSTAQGRTILPLSGGLDSRSLAMVLPDGPATEAYSYGYSPASVETNIAAQITRVKGFTFTAHTIPPYLFERLPEVVLALHGCQDVSTARQMSVNDWVRQRADAVISGLWGDVWCDQMGLADGLPEGMTLAGHTLYKMLKRGGDWLLKHVSEPQMGSDATQEILKARIGEGLSEFGAIEDQDWRVKAYKNTRWAFRWSNASLRGFEVGAPPRVPYYDVDLVDFFCTVPTEFVRDRRLQIAHIKRHAPRLARIRWQQAEANLHLARYGYWVSLPRRAILKAWRYARRQRALQRNWEVQFLSPQGRAGLEKWLLRPGLALHEFVSPSTVRTLVDDLFAQPGAANGYTVSMLLTFSAWLDVTHA